MLKVCREICFDKWLYNAGDDWRIPMDDPGASSSTADSGSTQRPLPPVEVKKNKSLEIVKCIVYGGLIESITSLVVIFSAAASDADTRKSLRTLCLILQSLLVWLVSLMVILEIFL